MLTKRMIPFGLFLVASACAAGAIAGADRAPAGDLPAPAGISPSGWTIPADAAPGVRAEVAALSAENHYLGHVDSVLVARCMREAGFTYPIQDLNRPMIPRDESYGLSAAEARRSGYATQSHILTIPAEDKSYLPAGEAQRRAWGRKLFRPDGAPTVEIDSPLGISRLGTSSRGCAADAQRTLFGSLETALARSEVAGNFRYRASLEWREDPVLRALNEAWSACMDQGGRPGLTEPGHAKSLARKHGDGSQAAQGIGEPRLIAIADATCQEETDYAPQRRAIEDRYLTAALTEFAVEVAAARAATEAALRRAQEIVPYPSG